MLQKYMYFGQNTGIYTHISVKTKVYSSTGMFRLNVNVYTTSSHNNHGTKTKDKSNTSTSVVKYKFSIFVTHSGVYSYIEHDQTRNISWRNGQTQKLRIYLYLVGQRLIPMLLITIQSARFKSWTRLITIQGSNIDLIVSQRKITTINRWQGDHIVDRYEIPSNDFDPTVGVSSIFGRSCRQCVKSSTIHFRWEIMTRTRRQESLVEIVGDEPFSLFSCLMLDSLFWDLQKHKKNTTHYSRRE